MSFFVYCVPVNILLNSSSGITAHLVYYPSTHWLYFWAGKLQALLCLGTFALAVSLVGPLPLTSKVAAAPTAHSLRGPP